MSLLSHFRGDGHKRSGSHDDGKKNLKGSGSIDSDSDTAANVQEQTLDGVDPNASEDTVTRDNRQGLMKTLANAMGLDLTAIALPVTINEPMSFLMRLCEMYQYSDLLDKANHSDSSVERMLLVSAFFVSSYANAERTGKPFNPLLGETYEYVDPARANFHFIAEQVSHHPPIGACHVESDNYILHCSQRLKTKFAGNSLDADAIGQSYVTLKKTKETYKWHFFKTQAHNIIVGSMWFDHYGEQDVVNQTTGEKCHIEMKKCGWFSKGWHEVNGTVVDAKGKTTGKFCGKWNEAIYRIDPKEKFDDFKMPGDSKQDKKDAKEAKKLGQSPSKSGDDDRLLFTPTAVKVADDKIPNKFLEGWTENSFAVVRLDDEMKAHLISSDSRLRPDRAALEVGDVKTATTAKNMVEEKQREEKRKGISKEPRFFKPEKDSDGEDHWVFTGTYWKEREERIKAAKK